MFKASLRAAERHHHDLFQVVCGAAGGRRKWVSIFASKGHVYMTVAGLRFDTSYITDGDRSGPGWSEYMRSSKGFRTRHPRGL